MLQVTGLAVSDRHPYMFSAGLDKMVKCWDLEYNKVRATTCAFSSLQHCYAWGCTKLDACGAELL